MPRMEFSRKVRRAIIERAQGKCEACGAALKSGEAEVDHILPDALGGKPEAVNAMCMCRVCHHAKTVWDVRSIRKADRARDKRTGAIKPKGTIPSRPKQERTGKAPLAPKLMFWPIAGHRESGD